MKSYRTYDIIGFGYYIEIFKRLSVIQNKNNYTLSITIKAFINTYFSFVIRIIREFFSPTS